ncbi:hypothetical protein Hanom_Chr07g00641181 [Helianthus anomalus]
MSIPFLQIDSKYKSKVHRWPLWFTKILDLDPSFPKVHKWSRWFTLCNAFSPQLCQKSLG